VKIELRAQVTGDGSVALHWQADDRVSTFHLLIIRTGSVPAFTALQFGADTTRYEIHNLSRHQRYRMAVMATGPSGPACTTFWNVTPATGLVAMPELRSEGIEPHLSQLTRATVMPQDGRLTVFWKRSPGFVDKVLVELRCGNNLMREIEVEPEVSSLSFDKDRGVALTNGNTYKVRLRTRFAGSVRQTALEIAATPAPQGQERPANACLPQQDIIYATLALTPELKVFDDDTFAPDLPATTHVTCFCCRSTVEWQGYRMHCKGCGAEFIANGRGDFLELGSLRFGTCRCCMPKKILIQKASSQSLICAHSGKEHIRLQGAGEFSLIEDLPFGLCQCCRPRRPLEKKGNKVVCVKSGEQHRNENGSYVLVPSAPVFDARRIDDLLDSGLAEICSTGVSRGRA
jgi:hypothetical protein